MRTTTVAALMLALTAGSTMVSAQPVRPGAGSRGAVARDGNPRDADTRSANARNANARNANARNANARNANARDGNARNANARGRGDHSPAAALLRQRDRLSLTADQTRQLETLASAQREARAGSPAQQLRLRADLLDATGRTFNSDAARTALDRLSDARNARIVATLQAREQARAVLTPAQLSQVDAARNARGPMHAEKAGDRGRRGAAPGARRG